MLAEAVSRNYTFDRVVAGLDVQVAIGASGATVEDVLAVMKQLNEEGILLSDFIEHYKMMKSEGLQFADIKRHLDYKKSLEKVGFGLNSLRLIQEAAVKFDSNPDTVLKAIDTYGEIQKLIAELETLRESKKSEEARQTALNTAVTELESKQKRLQDTIKENDNTIQQLNRTLELGYNLESLRNLEQRTLTLGGLDNFLIAIAKYNTLIELEDNLSKTQASIDKLNAEKTKMKAENLQYATEIETTRKLIIDHKLGLEALQELLQLCMKYGAPEGVFRAIRAYDNFKTLESEVAVQQGRVAELNGKEKELTEKLDSHLPKIEKMLLDIQTAFKTDVDDTKAKLKNDLDEVLKTVYEAGTSYEELVKRAEANAPYMELLQLTKDPKSVNNPRIMDTIELILKNLNEWIPLNSTCFRNPNEALYVVAPGVKDLLERLEKSERVRPIPVREG